MYYFEGEGGIGKTALLLALLNQIRDEVRIGTPAEGIIDLYHVDYQTPTGLAEGIIHVLGDHRSYFAEYQDFVEKLRRRTSGGTLEAWEEAWRAFAEGLNRLAADLGPLLIVLDTVEILQYENVHDPFQEEIGHRLPLASIGRWLLEALLPQLQGPIFWVWAGRPGALNERLEALRRIRRPLAYRCESLPPLTREESQQYIREVAMAIVDQDPAGARNLRQYVERYPEGLYAGTQGRPILLALASDILRVGGALPPRFYGNRPYQGDSVRLEKELADHLLRLPPSVKDTLVAMSFLRKGANAELLARLLGLEEAEAERRLQAVEDLALVKKRPEGKHPYFLHDELYHFFDRHIYIEESERCEHLDRVLAYYDAQIDDTVSNLSRYRTINLEAELRALQVERFHYLFQRTPAQGFAEYFLQAEDALNGRDHEMDMLLRTELLRTLVDLERADRTSPDLHHKVELDAAIRWGVRTMLMENDAEAAETIFREVREWKRGGTKSLYQPLRWYLALYEGVADLKQNRYDAAEKRLGRIDENLRELDQSDQVVRVLEALTWNYSGYLSRLRGRYYQAVERYQQAAMGFRALKMGSLVFTLINQAYAMTQVGHFRHARLILQEAYKQAQEENRPYWQANTLNVRALVETADGHTRTGLRFADDALDILDREIEDRRLRGLILLTRARAYRYLWNDYVTEDRWEHTGLHEALLPAYHQLEGDEHGLTLLIHNGGFAYTVEGMVESGCVFRSMTWVYYHLPPLRRRDFLGSDLHLFETAELYAERRFLEAAGIEEPAEAWLPQVREQVGKLGGDPYLPALSLVNLGWHYHYQRDRAVGPQEREKLQASIAKIRKLIYELIPESYHLPSPSMDRRAAQISLWSVLGKLEMLGFHEAIWGWDGLNEAQKEDALREGVKHAMYSLEYDHQMGDLSFDLQHAEEGLHRRLLKFPDWQSFVLPRLYEYEQAFAGELEPVLTGQSTFRRWLAETLGETSVRSA
jgi:hypothetical protein